MDDLGATTPPPTDRALDGSAAAWPLLERGLRLRHHRRPHRLRGPVVTSGPSPSCGPTSTPPGIVLRCATCGAVQVSPRRSVNAGWWTSGLEVLQIQRLRRVVRARRAGGPALVLGGDLGHKRIAGSWPNRGAGRAGLEDGVPVIRRSNVVGGRPVASADEGQHSNPHDVDAIGVARLGRRHPHEAARARWTATDAVDEGVHARGRGAEAHAGEGAGGIVRQVPVADAAVRRRQLERSGPAGTCRGPGAAARAGASRARHRRTNARRGWPRRASRGRPARGGW
jgi:hypothetical protein